MKKEMTIEHLAAYLPYGVKARYTHGNDGAGLDDIVVTVTGVEMTGNGIYYRCRELDWPIQLNRRTRLIVRPLSQLTEVIEHNGERFVPSQRIDNMGYRVHPLTYESIGVHALPYWVVQLLLSWHFDIFQLGDSGLAEPIPSIEQP
jgi:hypothetical protein